MAVGVRLGAHHRERRRGPLLRVLFVTPYPPERDGIGTYSALIRQALVQHGAEVAVIASRSMPNRPAEVLGSLPATRRQRDALERAIRGFAPDVVHVQFAIAAYGARLPLLLSLLARLRRAGRPVLVTMHEVTRDVASLRRVGRTVYRLVEARADHLVVHTEPSRSAFEQIVSRGRTEVSVIPHHRTELPRGDVDPRAIRRRYGLGADPVVLAFGFIDVDKGLLDLVTAVGKLQRSGGLGAARLVVAGSVRRRFGAFRVFELRDRRHLQSIKRAVADLGLERRVHFVGYVPGTEVRTWFDLATLAVLAYRRSEQSGVASLAVAAGTPLLTTNLGELPAMSTFPPVPPGDPVTLSTALSAALSTAESDRGVRAPGGDVDEVAAQTIGAYQRLRSTAPSGRTAR